MSLILTAEELRKVDATTMAEEGISSLELMERAANACADIIHALVREEHSFRDPQVVILCGRGNNGGDGWVIARLLAHLSYRVEVIDCALGQPSPDNQANRQKAEQLPIFIHTLQESDSLPAIAKQTLIIDAIFGTGLNRKVSGGWASIIESINLLPNSIWSIDIPSGVFTDQPTNSAAIRANRCFSLGYPKLAEFAPENAVYFGLITRVDFKLSSASNIVDSQRELLTARQVQSWLKVRGQFGHKGTYGHALLIAGSFGSIGAAVLAARACLRSGAGKLTCYLPHCGYQVMQTSVPEAMCRVDPHEQFISSLPATDGHAAIGIGPGIGQDFTTGSAMHQLLKEASVPVVIDADALNILGQNPDWQASLLHQNILTPHPKEFDRLFGPHHHTFDRWETQRAQAIELGCTILLKGRYTTIADPSGSMTFNPTGNPGMGTAGMGDVLTGIITGLVAQGYTPDTAARLGTYLHGLAGDLGADAGAMESLIASDVIDYLGQAFTALRKG